MPINTLELNLDGSSDFDTLWGTDSWDQGGWKGYLSIFDETVGNHLVTTANFSGENWTIAALRFGAETENTAILQDTDDGEGRNIHYLKLGDNSEVELISTRVRFIEGYDGDLHDITLGSADTKSISLDAAVNRVTTGSGYVGDMNLRGDDTVVVGTGGAGLIKVGDGVNSVTVNSGYVTSVASFRDSRNTIEINDGGIDQVTLRTGTHTISVNESNIGGLTVYRDGATTLESTNSTIQQASLGSSDDSVTLDDAWLGTLRLREGDDSVMLTNTARLGTVSSSDFADITVKRDSRLNYVEIEGDSEIDVQDTSQIYSIKAYRGDQLITADKGMIETIHGYDTNMTMSIGSGGVGQILLTGDSINAHDIHVDGWLGSLQIHNEAKVDLTLGASGAGTVNLSSADDTVTTGSGYVDYIRTGDGADLVTMGQGGIANASLGRGDDVIKVSETDPNYLLSVRGQSGSDTIDLSSFDTKLIFSLAQKGAAQNFAAPRAADDLEGKGWLQAVSVENLIGGSNNDKLTGNTADNILRGGAGGDVLKGGGGADTIIGGSGRDKLYAGKDGDADTFVFESADDSATGRQRDMIIQFDSAEDYIDLSGIDADIRTSGNQSFDFSGSAAGNSVWLRDTGKHFLVSADVDGDGNADFEILVKKIGSIGEDDFLL
ncbi:M10 family metallopeptidase C-terminal domain-containing protein [Donghicola eburneus]|uniref:M10 family metallopeptidase C-terminal domain-containing protein n=1 Tax=Donghicola eburneus TaxID=393278 RepID=UPI0008E330B7|nr:M10 family metallopeptidase C-terminal domain-containing protein [Donghicola eburneus]SFQ75455.1 Peptidase M10 serralysin C terminal [Donghicola eburneus]